MAEMKEKYTSNMPFGDVTIILKIDGKTMDISEYSSAGIVLKKGSCSEQIQCSFQDLPSCSQTRNNSKFFFYKEGIRETPSGEMNHEKDNKILTRG